MERGELDMRIIGLQSTVRLLLAAGCRRQPRGIGSRPEEKAHPINITEEPGMEQRFAYCEL
jgi:hypothetical protein